MATKLTKEQIRKALRSEPHRPDKPVERLNIVEQRYISYRIDVLEIRYLRMEEEDRLQLDEWFAPKPDQVRALDRSLLMVHRNVNRNRAVRIKQLEIIDEIRRGIQLLGKQKD